MAIPSRSGLKVRLGVGGKNSFKKGWGLGSGLGNGGINQRFGVGGGGGEGGKREMLMVWELVA